MAKNRNAILIALFLMIAMAVSLVALPTANAHTPPWKITTFAYMSVAPNPVGVGQTAAIYMWLYNTFDSEALTNDYRFHNYKLTITQPNGNTETINFDYISDPTSSVAYFFAPDQVGTYKLDFTFPGQDVKHMLTTHIYPALPQLHLLFNKNQYRRQ